MSCGTSCSIDSCSFVVHRMTSHCKSMIQCGNYNGYLHRIPDRFNKAKQLIESALVVVLRTVRNRKVDQWGSPYNVQNIGKKPDYLVRVYENLIVYNISVSLCSTIGGYLETLDLSSFSHTMNSRDRITITHRMIYTSNFAVSPFIFQMCVFDGSLTL